MNPFDASYSQCQGQVSIIFEFFRRQYLEFSDTSEALKFYENCFIFKLSLRLHHGKTKIEYALLWKSYIMVVSQARSRHLACIVCSPFHIIHLCLCLLVVVLRLS